MDLLTEFYLVVCWQNFVGQLVLYANLCNKIIQVHVYLISNQSTCALKLLSPYMCTGAIHLIKLFYLETNCRAVYLPLHYETICLYFVKYGTRLIVKPDFFLFEKMWNQISAVVLGWCSVVQSCVPHRLLVCARSLVTKDIEEFEPNICRLAHQICKCSVLCKAWISFIL